MAQAALPCRRQIDWISKMAQRSIGGCRARDRAHRTLTNIDGVGPVAKPAARHRMIKEMPMLPLVLSSELARVRTIRSVADPYRSGVS